MAIVLAEGQTKLPSFSPKCLKLDYILLILKKNLIRVPPVENSIVQFGGGWWWREIKEEVVPIFDPLFRISSLDMEYIYIKGDPKYGVIYY